jgi:hypothetical protein
MEGLSGRSITPAVINKASNSEKRGFSGEYGVIYFEGNNLRCGVLYLHPKQQSGSEFLPFGTR